MSEQVPEPSDPPHFQECSFCKKTRAEVRKLVAGPDVSICDECVGLCVEIIRQDERIAAPAPLASATVARKGWRGWIRRVF